MKICFYLTIVTTLIAMTGQLGLCQLNTFEPGTDWPVYVTKDAHGDYVLLKLNDKQKQWLKDNREKTGKLCKEIDSLLKEIEQKDSVIKIEQKEIALVQLESKLEQLHTAIVEFMNLSEGKIFSIFIYDKEHKLKTVTVRLVLVITNWEEGIVQLGLRHSYIEENNREVLLADLPGLGLAPVKDNDAWTITLNDGQNNIWQVKRKLTVATDKGGHLVTDIGNYEVGTDIPLFISKDTGDYRVIKNVPTVADLYQKLTRLRVNSQSNKSMKDAQQATLKSMKDAQQAALKTLTGKGVKAPKEMVLVPPGEFILGADDGNPNEKPERKMALSAFWIDVTEVTNAQFAKFVQAAGYKPAGGWKLEAGKEQHPATRVTWADAAAYAKWAGKRLPTEAEWEKAARGTDGRTYPWGNEVAVEQANLAGLADGFAETAPCGTFKASDSVWGALDLAGNAWEWCADAYAPYDAPGDGPSKTIRGGSFASTPKAGRCTARAALLPTVALAEVGFRCVKDEQGLPPVVVTPAPNAPVLYDGEVAFAMEPTTLKCTLAFDKLSFTTPEGTLTVARVNILAVSATEISLLGGSILKGTLRETLLPVTWSLGKRDIPMATAAYRRVTPPPVLGVNVTKDGEIVPPAFNVRLTLADEGQLVGNLRETSLRVRQADTGELDIPLEKVLQVEKVDGRLFITLTDGNEVAGELLGQYHLDLLEGSLTLNDGLRLASLTFGTSSSRYGVITRVNPKDGATMVYVPAGDFLMGSDLSQHTVYLNSYWIYQTEVTVAQYRKFCQVTDRQMPAEPSWKWQDDHPIENVSWEDAAAYAQWAGATLPTEAQWEKAARGTDGRVYPWGNDWDGAKCVNSTRIPKSVGSCPVGASPYGALDMAGNVWEWCADWYDAGYYKTEPVRNPPGPATGMSRVLRGGAWYLKNSDSFRAAYRFYDVMPTYRNYYSFGFRCVLRSLGQ